MQIALPGSLHRVIVWLCTQQVSTSATTVEAHDADRPAGLAASCHRVAQFQLSTTCVQSAPVCESPASGAVTLLGASSSADQPFFFKKKSPNPPQAQGRTCCSSPWRAHCTLCAIYASLQVLNHLVLVLYHSV